MNDDIKVQMGFLRQKQSLSLDSKVELSKERIREWYDHFNGKVYVAFSGGKDSTVLLHIVRSIYPDVEAVFLDTGLEFPEVRAFVRTIPNVTWLRPEITFKEIIEKYGYPVISKEQAKYIYEWRNTNSEKVRKMRWEGRDKDKGFKIAKKWQDLAKSDIKISHKCCDIMKINTFRRYERKTGNMPIVALLAEESDIRRIKYLKKGCNIYDCQNPTSNPMGFWLENDIWEYIRRFNIPYSTIYDKGYDRTGCMFCMFGVHMDKGTNKFQMMKVTHPKIYDYCINKLGIGKVLDSIGVKYT